MSDVVRPGLLEKILPYVVGLIALVVVVMMIAGMQGAGGGGGSMANFGKSKARMISDADNKINFDEVAGLKEEKEDLEAFINEESNVYLTSLYESKNQVREAIQGIEIEHKAYDRVGMVREVFQWVDSGIEYYKQKTKDEKVSVPYNKETNESDETSQDYNWIESGENLESNRVEKKLRGLQNDQLNQAIDEFCQRAYEIVFVKLDAKFSDINAIIQSIAVNYVDKYYSQIIALLEEVKLQLDKKANECKRV